MRVVLGLVQAVVRAVELGGGAIGQGRGQGDHQRGECQKEQQHLSFFSLTKTKLQFVNSRGKLFIRWGHFRAQ